MSDETKALAHAIASLARSNLDLVTEMKQSRMVQQQMASTLVQIYEGQKEIVERMNNNVGRTTELEKGQRQSDGKIKVVEAAVGHLQARVKALEAKLDA
jgi:hypothetical protein